MKTSEMSKEQLIDLVYQQQRTIEGVKQRLPKIASLLEENKVVVAYNHVYSLIDTINP